MNMAAPSGALRQCQALPFPIRLAGIFLAVMAMIWLTRWLGGISVLVALLLSAGHVRDAIGSRPSRVFGAA
jgi:hypothetical protein